eukprot:s1840_g6.t1
MLDVFLFRAFEAFLNGRPCLLLEGQACEADIVASRIGQDNEVEPKEPTEPRGEWRSPFTQVLNSSACQRLLVVPNEELKTNGQGLYSRLWCIWEIKVAADAGLPIIILPDRSSDEHLLGKSIISSRNARCGNPFCPMNKDELLIRAAIARMPPESNRSSAYAFFGICFCTSYGAVVGGGVSEGTRATTLPTSRTLEAMDVQSEARSLLSAWLRHEEEAADLRSLATSAHLRSDGYSEAPKMNLAKEDAKWNAYKTVENRLRAVRVDVSDGALAEDVDVALRLLAQRRREQCEAKAMARAPRAPTRSVPAGSDPALRMEARHQARDAARHAVRAGRHGTRASRVRAASAGRGVAGNSFVP